MTGNRKKKKALFRRGFTLIESLVAASLFVIAISVALSMFLVYSKAQRESGLRQSTLNSVSYEIEKIAQEIRLSTILFSGTINYGGGSRNIYSFDGDAGISAREDELSLQPTSGNRISYVFFSDSSENECSAFSSVSGLFKYVGSGCEPVFRIDNVTIEDVGFFISPDYEAYPDENADCLSNVFNGYYCECSSHGQCGSGVCDENSFCLVHQPAVTIFIRARIGEEATSVMNIQTTVSSRKYQ